MGDIGRSGPERLVRRISESSGILATHAKAQYGRNGRFRTLTAGTIPCKLQDRFVLGNSTGNRGLSAFGCPPPQALREDGKCIQSISQIIHQLIQIFEFKIDAPLKV